MGGSQISRFPISVGTTEDVKAIDVLRAEIDNLGEQNGRINSLGWRLTMDAAQKQFDDTGEGTFTGRWNADFTGDLIDEQKR